MDEQSSKSGAGGTVLVIAVIALVLGVVGFVAQTMGRVRNGGAMAQGARARADLSQLKAAVSRFQANTGRIPTNEEGLQVLIEGKGVAKWAGPYLDKVVPNDPWGRPYSYRKLGGSEFEVATYGLDGRRGGSGGDQDFLITTSPTAMLVVAQADMQKRAKASQDISNLREATNRFRLNCDRFPTTREGLSVLLKGTGIKGWSGPYLAGSLPLDPWGHPYYYQDDGNDRFSVISFGRDGKPGGNGEDADLPPGP